MCVSLTYLSKAWLILVLNFAFWHEIFIFASSTNLYGISYIWFFFQWTKRRGTFFFSKNLKVIKNILKKKQFLGSLLYPWKLLTTETCTPGNSGNLCYTPWKFFIFLDHPGIFCMYILFLQYPRKFCAFKPLYFFFFFSIPHGTMIKLLFIKVL